MADAEQTSAELLDELRDGSESAAEIVFDRYVDRLTRLARGRLSGRLARRIDAEDVVQSAWRSFFVAARNGRFELPHRGDLWRLLVRITLHKLSRQSARHQAERRSFKREQYDHGLESTDRFPTVDFTDRNPTPDEAVALADELEKLFAQLSAPGRQVLELRLQGVQIAEIAERVSRSERTVGRMLADVRRRIRADAGFQIADEAVPALPPRDVSPEHPDEANPLPADVVQLVSMLFLNRGESRFEDYLLQQLLGMGASSKVYRAFERPTGRCVAVKFLRKDLLADTSLVRRFVQEVDLVARLNHPGIVPVLGFGRTPIGGFFIVQEFVAGGSLDDAMRSGPIADCRVAAEWIAQAASAVHHAHLCGVVHCDLKPGNLLLDEAGRIRVADFGLARRLGNSLEVAGIAGTAGFMAPEQVDSCWGEIGPRTDVYGLGAVLFALLAGRPPNVGQTLADVLADVVGGRSNPDLADFRAGVPVDVQQIVSRCLAKPPTERFANAAELSAALQAASSPEKSTA